MAGTCEHCGEISEKMVTCSACGAQVCPEHSRDFGCEVCQGGVIRG